MCCMTVQLPEDSRRQTPKPELLNSELQLCNILRMGMHFQACREICKL